MNTSMDHAQSPAHLHHDDELDRKHALMVVHGALMLLGWGLLLPMGVAVAVLRNQIGSQWIKWHRNLQLAGVSMGLGGYFVARAMTDHHSHEALISLHHVCGMFLTFWAVFQVAIGLLRPHPPKPDETKSVIRAVWEPIHKALGYVSLLVALEQVVTGSILSADFAGGDVTAWLVASVCVLLFAAVGSCTVWRHWNAALDFQTPRP